MELLKKDIEMLSVTCPKCGRIVTKATENSSGESICPSCKTKFQYNTFKKGISTLIVDNKSA